MYEHILKTQRSFARKAEAVTNHRFEDLYYLICREDWIRAALERVLANRGSRTAGVDGISKDDLKTEAERKAFIEELQTDLKAGNFAAIPVKRTWIDKPGKDEKRPLGIPIIRDRVVQQLLKMLIEPIWESDFLDCSHGFRRGRRTMDCIYTFYSRVHTTNKYYIAIEGDIRKCFDRINHKILLKLIRKRIADTRIVNLIEAFLKAGVMEGELFQETPEGTPQGGILSPLLANIYLHVLDEWWWEKFGCLTHKEKWKRREKGLGNAILVRYADDFVILWNGTREAAFALRNELKQFLWDELRLELNEDKTHVTYLTDGIEFLGFHIQLIFPTDNKPWLRVTPTKSNIKRFRSKIKALTKRGTTFISAEQRFKGLNRIIRGWGNYYRHVSFTHDAKELDFWLNERVLIWLKNKHGNIGIRRILEQYKQREITKKYNRWNFGVNDGQTGETIFIAKLADIRLTRYLRKKSENPFLKLSALFDEPDDDTPFLEPRLINTNAEATELYETKANVRQRDGYTCTNCGRQGVLFDVHHIKAQKDGGTHEMDNLTTLCEPCHLKTESYGGLLNGKKS